MNRFLLIFTALIFLAMDSAQAKFFNDNFEDRDIEDNMPVSWNDAGFNGILDATTGDLIVMPTDQFAVGEVEGLDYTDVTILTQLRV